MLNCILVGIGGFIGTVCRYLIGLIPIKENSGFPIKTLAINIIGSLLIGIITAVAVKNKALDSRIVLVLKVGICGGFTTFSSFAYETVDLMQRGSMAVAFWYISLSVILGIFAVFGAQMLIR